MTARPFTVMAKPIGPRCNISCSYCYYLEKEKQFPSEKKFRMPEEVLETYIRQMIGCSVEAGMNEVTFAWQGGEPTMLGVGYFEKIIGLQRKHAPAGVKVVNLLQTNGTLLDDDWARFLQENDFLVGISIDGPRTLHDRYRIDRAGRPTFDAVMRGLAVLQRHAVEHNALTVVHRDNALHGKEIYRFLKKIGIRHMQFIPIVERTRDGKTLSGAPEIDDDPENHVTPWSVSARVYGKFLCDVFDIWSKRDIGEIFVQHFDVMVGKWLGVKSSLCVFGETCGDGLALEHNGNLYACDHFVYPEYLLGNITTTPLADLAWSERQQAFGRNKSESLTRQCQACRYRFACNGGCPKHRFAISRDGEPGHNYFCKSYTTFFRHAEDKLKEMAALVRMGLPAAGANRLPTGPRSHPAG